MFTPLPCPQTIDVLVPNFPADESRGFHKVPFQPTVYIEETDFREVSWARCSVPPGNGIGVGGDTGGGDKEVLGGGTCAGPPLAALNCLAGAG